jgi:hypothetical protein
VEKVPSWYARIIRSKTAKREIGFESVRKFHVAESLERRVLLSAPVITGVDPDPLNLTSDTSAQSVDLTITGSNFNIGLDKASKVPKVTLTTPEGATEQELGNVDLATSTSTEIDLVTPDFAKALAPGTWTIQVINTDGSASGQFAFDVTRYDFPPVITSVSPDPLIVPPASTTTTLLNVEGSNFQIIPLSAPQGEVYLIAPGGQDVTGIAVSWVNNTADTLFDVEIPTSDLDTYGPGQWKVDFVNNSGLSSGGFPFTVVDAVTPTISQQPQSRTVTVGSSVTFSVSASSNVPLSYQWQFNGTTLANETDSTLTLNAVTPAEAGAYQVVVSDEAGSVTSDPATLTVVTPKPPTITTQPLSQTVNAGGNVTFSVTASSTTALQYQWQINGTNLTGDNDSFLTLPNVTAADAGAYAVVVSNTIGSITSATAALTVNPSVSTPSGPLSLALASPAAEVKAGKHAKAVLTITNTSGQTIKESLAISLLLSSDDTLAGEIAGLLSSGKKINLKAGRSKAFALSFKVPAGSVGSFELLVQVSGGSPIVAPSPVTVLAVTPQK